MDVLQTIEGPVEIKFFLPEKATTVEGFVTESKERLVDEKPNAGTTHPKKTEARKKVGYSNSWLVQMK